MFKIFKKKKVDLEKGRKIFFEAGGSRFTIDREYGPEYWDCSIPKDIEEKWKEEIKKIEDKKNN